MKIDHILPAALLASATSAAQLAKKLGVSPSYVSQLLSGKRGATPEALDRIAGLIGCTVDVTATFVKIKPAAK